MHESENLEHKSKNVGGHTNNESKQDTIGTIEETTEQTSTKKQEGFVSASTQSRKSPLGCFS